MFTTKMQKWIWATLKWFNWKPSPNVTPGAGCGVDSYPRIRTFVENGFFSNQKSVNSWGCVQVGGGFVIEMKLSLTYFAEPNFPDEISWITCEADELYSCIFQLLSYKVGLDDKSLAAASSLIKTLAYHRPVFQRLENMFAEVQLRAAEHRK